MKLFATCAEIRIVFIFSIVIDNFSLLNQAVFVTIAFMRISAQKIKEFQTFIFSRWKKNKRDLPWRKTSDPYEILVSEMMLQQTQTARVIPMYESFLLKFPTVSSLARSPLSDVLKAWKGLGYNRRAVYLHTLAKIIVHSHRGEIPHEENQLLKLPGIGLYTARAIQIFAFRKNIAAIDTNIRQIITSVFFNGKKQPDGIIEEVAQMILPKKKSWEWHQALMDYGALELNKLIERSSKKKNNIPFIQSNRYFRGRIVDMLRRGEVSKAVFMKVLIDRFDKTPEFYESIIKSLINDGLIEIKEGVFRLPE